jgi:hypothetical protein
MKKILFILISLFVFSETYTQTLNETIDWINSTLGDYRPLFYDNLLKRYESTILEVKVDGSFEVNSNKYKTVFPEVLDGVVTFKGNLKNMSLNGLDIEQLNDGSYILLVKCYNNNRCVSQINYSVIKNKKNEIKFVADNYIVTLAHFDDKELELAQRSKKAIMHLMKLLGAKNEAF